MSPERTEFYLVAIVALLAAVTALLAGVVSLGTPAMASSALVFVVFAVGGVVAYDVNRRSA
ncbi:hypothetical protein [Haladaptatus sp. NG-WS-4]